MIRQKMMSQVFSQIPINEAPNVYLIPVQYLMSMEILVVTRMLRQHVMKENFEKHLL